MCKSEIFAETINLVSQETEIPAERILSPDKDAETVGARYLLVSLLADRGMYPSQNHSRNSASSFFFISSSFILIHIFCSLIFLNSSSMHLLILLASSYRSSSINLLFSHWS